MFVVSISQLSISHIGILIAFQDDVLPMLVQNGVGSVANGNMLKLTSELLRAKVMDKNKAPSSDIIYTLVPTINNPKYGINTQIKKVFEKFIFKK